MGAIICGRARRVVESARGDAMQLESGNPPLNSVAPSPAQPQAPAPPRPIALDYHKPTAKRGTDVSRYLGKPLGLCAMFAGAALFPMPSNAMQPLGLALVSAGCGWWVWCHRARFSLVLRTQF